MKTDTRDRVQRETNLFQRAFSQSADIRPKFTPRRALAWCWILTLVALGALHAESPKVVLAHYLPWYASKPVSGRWGWHWTMGHYDPDRVLEDGRREIASHDYPLIGPYDSGDPDLLEYHVLLMKFAGLDGVVIDWYGFDAYRDYDSIHRNAQRLIRYLKKAGLKFAICYEDRTVQHLVEGGVLKASEEVAYGKAVMRWLDEHWFGDTAYVTLDGRPLLLVFGPQHLLRDSWAQMLAATSRRPWLYALPHLAEEAGADGVFGWPPVYGGEEVTPSAWRDYLRRLYSGSRPFVAVAFPKFHDIYREAGLHDSYGYLDSQGGRTFEETLDLAWRSGARVIQIATWNDYGEGTEIEPTKEFGYRYLESLQRRRSSESGGVFPYTPDDLRLPGMLYEKRKRFAGDADRIRQLDRASSLLFAGECDEGRVLIENLVSYEEAAMDVQEQRVPSSTE